MTSGAVSIDRETVSEYRLGVLACAGQWCAANASLSVSVHVLDANDQSPRWWSAPARAVSSTVMSDAPRATRIVQLSATDSDLAHTVNSLVTYRTHMHTRDSSSRLLSVEPLTGWVTVADSLIDSSGHLLTLWVVADDHGSPRRHSRPISVHIRVLSHRRRPIITAPPHQATISQVRVN